MLTFPSSLRASDISPSNALAPQKSSSSLFNSTNLIKAAKFALVAAGSASLVAAVWYASQYSSTHLPQTPSHPIVGQNFSNEICPLTSNITDTFIQAVLPNFYCPLNNPITLLKPQTFDVMARTVFNQSYGFASKQLVLSKPVIPEDVAPLSSLSTTQDSRSEFILSTSKVALEANSRWTATKLVPEISVGLSEMIVGSVKHFPRIALLIGSCVYIPEKYRYMLMFEPLIHQVAKTIMLHKSMLPVRMALALTAYAHTPERYKLILMHEGLMLDYRIESLVDYFTRRN